MAMNRTVLGIDIGGTRIKAGLVDAGGRILRSASAPSPSSLAAFRKCVSGLVEDLGGEPDGAGFACKGIIAPGTTRVSVLPGTLHYLEGDTLECLLPRPMPSAADNDARAALAGEVAWGAALGRRDAILLTLGTGVGGGVLAGGRILRGAGGAAGHLGHLTVDPDGSPCICGSRGCLETVFSARAIEARAFEIVHRGCQSGLWERYGEDPLKITCEGVFELAAGGDPLSRRIVDEAVRKLGAAIAGLALIFDPEVVILGGQIASAGEALLAPLRAEVNWRAWGMLRREVQICQAQAMGESGIAGAAALILNPSV